MAESSSHSNRNSNGNGLPTPSGSLEANAQEAVAPTSEADVVLLAFIDRVASAAEGAPSVEYTGTLRAHHVERFLHQQQKRQQEAEAAAVAAENAPSEEKQNAAATGGEHPEGLRPEPENSSSSDPLVSDAQQQQEEQNPDSATGAVRQRSSNRTLSSVVRAARVASAVSSFWGAREAQLQRLTVLEPWNINRIGDILWYIISYFLIISYI